MFVQVVVTGLAAGAVYGLVAVGTSLAYRLTGVVPFALGDLVGLAVLAALAVGRGEGRPLPRREVRLLHVRPEARRTHTALDSMSRPLR